MKNLKVYFSAMVFVLAIGAAFVTKSSTPLVQGYIQAGASCTTSISCNDSSGPQCQNSNNDLLWKIPSGTTACTTALLRD